MLRSIRKFGEWFRVVTISIVTCFALISLPGCLEGNGEPYGKPNTPAEQGSPPSLLPGEYYWEDPDATCIKPNTGDSVASYRDRIQHTETGDFILRGNACEETEVVLDSSIEEIEVSYIHSILGYENGIYRYLKDGISDGRHVKEFCRTDIRLLNDHYAEIVVYENNTSGVQTVSIYLSLSGRTLSHSGSVIKTTSSTTTGYKAEAIFLEIDNVPSPSYDHKYDGTASISVDGLAIESTLPCRRLLLD